jgi:C4-dicarboxylate-specific signal transduction histidine kinase
MSIGKKLIIAFLAISLLPLVLVSLITYVNYKNSLEAVRMKQLVDVAHLKSERIEEYLLRLKAEIEMTEYFYNIKNNFPILVKNAKRPKSSAFLASTAMLDNQLSKIQEVLQLAGISLINLDGNVLYTSNKKTYAQYLSQPLPGLGLKAFTEGKKGIYFSDVFNNKFYGDEWHFFLTAPSHDLNKTLIGVIAFEVDMNTVNQIILDTTGLGQTGETLISRKINQEVVFLSPLKYETDAANIKRVPLGGGC